LTLNILRKVTLVLPRIGKNGRDGNLSSIFGYQQLHDGSAVVSSQCSPGRLSGRSGTGTAEMKRCHDHAMAGRADSEGDCPASGTLQGEAAFQLGEGGCVQPTE